MTIEEVIVTECSALAPTYALVEPPAVTGECIVYQLVSEVPVHMVDYVEPRVQLACRASSYGAAVQLANRVWQTFEGRHVTVGGVHYRSMVVNVLDGEPELDAGRYSRFVDVMFTVRKSAS